MVIRVLIVDNQQLFTEALRNLLDLEPDIEVVGEAYDGASGLEMISEVRPDVAVVDLRMPGLNGIEVAQRVKNEIAPQVRIVILTATEEDEFLTRAVEVGVEGYLTKDIAMETLASAIRRVVAGETVVPPNRLKHLLRNLANPDRKDAKSGVSMASYLTDREKEVLSLLVAGKSNQNIADELYISSNTVRTHIQNILSKLSVHSKLEAVAYAIKHNIVEVERAS